MAPQIRLSVMVRMVMATICARCSPEGTTSATRFAQNCAGASAEEQDAHQRHHEAIFHPIMSAAHPTGLARGNMREASSGQIDPARQPSDQRIAAVLDVELESLGRKHQRAS